MNARSAARAEACVGLQPDLAVAVDGPDHPADEGPELLAAGAAADVGHLGGDVGLGDDAGVDGVLEVVRAVRDPVGPADDLALDGRRRGPGPGVVADAVQGLGAQVQRGEDDVGAPGPVVVALGDEGVERVLAGVAAGSVTAVVTEGDRVDQGHVGPDPAGDRGGDLGHLQGVGQPGPLMITGIDHHLGLAGQPAERGRVHDPVPVPLEAGPLGVRFLFPGTVSGAPGAGGAGPQPYGFPLLPQLPGHHRTGSGQGVRGRVRPHQTGVRVTVHGRGPLLRSGGDVSPVLRFGHAGQPPEIPSSASASSRSTASGSSSQRSGSATFVRGEPCRPRGDPSSAVGNGTSGSSCASAASRSVKLEIRPERAPQVATDREALEVPGHVLAHLRQPVHLVAVAHQQLRVPPDHDRHLTERGQGPRRHPGERVHQVPEQPRPTEAAAADDHAVHAGPPHHLQRVAGLPDVPVAEHRDGHVLLQGRDRVPVRLARVRLLRGPPVQRDRRTPGLLRDPAGVQVRLMIMVDADPGLHGHRHPVRRRRPDHRGQDQLQPPPLVRQRRSPTLAGHLGHRAAEVQVHVVDREVVDQDLGGPPHDHRVDPVQLHRPDPLPRIELQHVLGLAVPLDDPAAGDHLADEQPRLRPGRHRPGLRLLPTQLPVRRIRDPRHRRQDHRRIHLQPTQLQPARTRPLRTSPPPSSLPRPSNAMPQDRLTRSRSPATRSRRRAADPAAPTQPSAPSAGSPGGVRRRGGSGGSRPSLRGRMVAADPHPETQRDPRPPRVRSDDQDQQPTRRVARYSVTLSRLTRSCDIVSRSRIVTASSSSVSKSTVMQYGVPISSWRR